MNPINSSLFQWIPLMRRALQLASIAEGDTSPNPLVGAVVLDVNGKIVGEGFHSRAGQSHAEIKALDQAKEKAKDGTLIVNLEPCCHKGKTPPCTESIIKANIKRVVIAMQDPDPRVSGKGITVLRNAGLDVITGVLEEEAIQQNRSFIFRVQNGRPWGILKWAMSLDGRNSLPNGNSKWISGTSSRKWVHNLRAKCDAVIVGGQTIRTDNPLLTSRGLSSPEPLRVVLTKSINIPKDSLILDTKIAKTLIVHGPEASTKNIKNFSLGFESLCLKDSTPLNLMRALAENGCNKVLWECGPKLATEAIKQNCIQEISIIIGSKILGGLASKNPLNDFGFCSMDQVISLENISLDRISEDILIKSIFPKKIDFP